MGNAVVGVEHHAVALLDGGIVLHLGAEGLNDAGYLIAGEKGAVADPVVGGALGHAAHAGAAGEAADDGAAEAQVLRQLGAQAGHGARAGHGRDGRGTADAVARTGADHLQAEESPCTVRRVALRKPCRLTRGPSNSSKESKPVSLTHARLALPQYVLTSRGVSRRAAAPPQCTSAAAVQ